MICGATTTWTTRDEEKWSLPMFLGLPIEEVFPISYDISRLCAQKTESSVGKIPVEPSERLSESDLI